MRYVEMTHEGLLVAGHLTSEEIFDWKCKGYTMKKAENVGYNVPTQKKKKRKEKPAVYNKAGVRIG